MGNTDSNDGNIVDLKKNKFKASKVCKNASEPIDLWRNNKQNNKETFINGTDDRKIFDELTLNMGNNKDINAVKIIVKLNAYFVEMNKEGFGTGNIVGIYNGKIYVLTCAHNVTHYSKFEDTYFDASNIWFIYKNIQYQGSRIYIYPKYKQKNEGNDIAIVVFENIGRFKYFNMIPSIMDANKLKTDKSRGYVLGYPKIEDDKIYGMSGDIEIQKNSNLLFYKIDTSNGQSGSIIFGKYNNSYKIIGIHTDGGGDFNYGTKIRKEILKWINECIKIPKEIKQNSESKDDRDGYNTIPFSDIDELRGPIDTQKNIFIRPASLFVTPIWYKCNPLNGEWKWTPYNPYSNQSKNYPWLPTNDLVVPIGFWKGEKPATCNRKIIKYLDDNSPIPPASSINDIMN